MADKPVFTFMVSKTDNKRSVVMKVKEMFGKDAINVRFLKNAAKKVKRQGVHGVRALRRKALVELVKGQKIKEFDIETKEDKKAKKAEVKAESKK